MSWPRVLDDLIVVFHAAYVGFVVLGLEAIVVGLLRGWAWVRNFWFWAAHLLAIALVGAEEVTGVACPLTVWEQSLRFQAGEGAYTGDFLGHWAHQLVFVDASPGMFTLAYVVFGALVVAAFVLGPPRRPNLARRGGA